MVGWHPQGWEAIHRINPDPAIADHVFEIADWAIDRQLTKNGAFLEDLSEKEPSFNTGFIAEGMASAWAIARRAGDDARARGTRTPGGGRPASSGHSPSSPRTSSRRMRARTRSEGCG